jgi:hypothetical protein
VQVVDENAPQTGPGRWCIPTHLIYNSILIKYIAEKGKEALQNIDENKSNRTDATNPQVIYAKFKEDIMNMARKRERAIIPKLILEIRKCENELDVINNNKVKSDEERSIKSKIQSQKLIALKRKQHLKTRSAIAVKNRIEGETMTRSWIQSNKMEKPRDIIYALRKPQKINNQEFYEKDSQKMAELARNYHENTQTDETTIKKSLKDQYTKEALAALKTEVNTEHSTLLGQLITEDEVEEAFQRSQNLKSPGMDGFTYELWKYIHQLYKSNKETENGPEILNIVKLLTECFNDIQIHGIAESTDFSLGWMWSNL